VTDDAAFHSSPSTRTATDVACRPVVDAGELAAHFAIRHQVFVVQQRLFEPSDRDEHDLEPGTLHVVALVDGMPAGAVRLYPLDQDGLWKGDRLAVLERFRRVGLGAPLVRCAVRTAGELGGQRMIAHIQLPNVAFFRRLGWEPVGEPAPYVGVVHQQMAIGL
jgi:putative N-acetyltransferase (TIGR04045 family)